MARIKPRFKLEWHAKEVMRAVSAMTKDEEKASAHRILKRARRYVPVGNRTINSRGKSWKSRHPGKLKGSLEVHESRYPEGGYVVFAGDDYDLFYAHFIEFGTIFMEKRKGYKFMRKATNLERARFVRQLRKNMGV